MEWKLNEPVSVQGHLRQGWDRHCSSWSPEPLASLEIWVETGFCDGATLAFSETSSEFL